MVEFALNSTISNLLGFVPFKLNYGYMPNVSPGITPAPSTMPGIKHFVMHALQNLTNAHDTIIESRIQQTHHANHCRCEDDHFIIRDLVYVSTADLSLPKGQAMKLLPKYIGSFKVLEAHPSMSTYRVGLPALLHTCNLHDRLHRSKLHPYYTNDDVLFPHWEAHAHYDFSTPDDWEQLVDKILAHKWEKNELMFLVELEGHGQI
jgi:hypothetical protein